MLNNVDTRVTSINQSLWLQLRQILALPILTLLIIILIDLMYSNCSPLIEQYFPTLNTSLIENIVYHLGLAGGCYWILLRGINTLAAFILNSLFFESHPTVRIIIPLIATVCKTLSLLIIVNRVIPALGFPPELSFVLDKASSILIILAVAWVLVNLVQIVEQLLLHYYPSSKDVMGRKIMTQTLILKRVALSIITILTIGSILMLFENVRTLGASVLTTAGIIGLVLTVAAQRSLGSIFSGLELALIQPIKIGDSIVIENEMGVVEEINFRNVVVKLWDWRRLIIPTQFFLDKPFQNWSREQTNNLIGTVFLHVDFTLPVAYLREELTRILKVSPLWDGKINSIQVTDAQERVMQLRILSSASNPGDAWDLRCEVREKLIAYIVQHYPACLPTTRTKPAATMSVDNLASIS